VELSKTDPEVYRAIVAELGRQRGTIELIAAENFTSPAVLAAQGSVLTNKYAEGYPGKRYYGGCQFVDVVEELARERALKLFGGDHVNVQPHSGAQANMAVFFTACRPGDTVLGMDLAHGGHLTHGSKVNFSGKVYNSVAYGLSRETETIDYGAVDALAKEHRPRLIIAGASAYPRIIDFAAFRRIADSVGALLMVDMAHIAGLVAAGLHPSPVPYADFVTTTTHKTLRGPRAGMVICKAEHAAALDKTVFPGMQGGPLMHVIAAKAVALGEALTEEFNAYQRQVVANAGVLADSLKRQGFRLVSGGTDNHLMLVDLGSKGVTGKFAEETLDKCGITVNKNAIPYDEQPPFVTSGMRLGTPAVTTRGFREEQMRDVAEMISLVIANAGDENTCAGIGSRVADLCAEFPLYPGMLVDC